MTQRHTSHYELLKKQAIARSNEKNTNDNIYGYCERCGYRAWRNILQLYCRGGTMRNAKLDDVVLICPQCIRHPNEKR